MRLEKLLDACVDAEKKSLMTGEFIELINRMYFMKCMMEAKSPSETHILYSDLCGKIEEGLSEEQMGEVEKFIEEPTIERRDTIIELIDSKF